MSLDQIQTSQHPHHKSKESKMSDLNEIITEMKKEKKLHDKINNNQPLPLLHWIRRLEEARDEMDEDISDISSIEIAEYEEADDDDDFGTLYLNVKYEDPDDDHDCQIAIYGKKQDATKLAKYLVTCVEKDLE